VFSWHSILLAHIWEELAGRFSGGLTGTQSGYQVLDIEQIALVEGWRIQPLGQFGIRLFEDISLGLE
jgi:hypothetical protein